MLFISVSDDRYNRKGGKYEKTQEKIKNFLIETPSLKINNTLMINWNYIKNSNFYKENKHLLSFKNPAINGRAYKPFAILEGMKKINFGDFLIYNDCSPELWDFLDNEKRTINTKMFDISIIKDLCRKNNDILTCFVFGDYIEGEGHWRGGPGSHTHERFTTPICMKYMGLSHLKYKLQGASGMIVIRKTKETLDLVKEWLHYNTIPECCSLGDIKNKTEETIVMNYWRDGLKENSRLHGHRHDQSILGLLLNRRNNTFIIPPHYEKYIELNNYNFLKYCIKGIKYRFYKD